jgi:hypothetical protein
LALTVRPSRKVTATLRGGGVAAICCGNALQLGLVTAALLGIAAGVDLTDGTLNLWLILIIGGSGPYLMRLSFILISSMYRCR